MYVYVLQSFECECPTALITSEHDVDSVFNSFYQQLSRNCLSSLESPSMSTKGQKDQANKKQEGSTTDSYALLIVDCSQASGCPLVCMCVPR